MAAVAADIAVVVVAAGMVAVVAVAAGTDYHRDGGPRACPTGLG